MDCKNCQTKLTEMKDGKGETTCLRCLKCHPMTKYVEPAKKEDRYVDVPWTDERVIEVIDKIVPDMIREVLENWHIQEPLVAKAEIKQAGNPEGGWREQAKELGIEVYDHANKKLKLKVDVLAEIAEKTEPSLV